MRSTRLAACALAALASAPGASASADDEIQRSLPFTTLEDIYGDAGNSFQGALGFWVQEGDVFNPPFPGYGVGVDDMVVEWREVALVKDATSCATGACATLGIDATNRFEGSGTLTVTVLDPSPWDPVHPENDCNGDGDFDDPGDDPDCDDDGIEDVTVIGFSTGEPAGEVFALNRVSPGGARWRGEIPFSSSLDLPGTLYLVRAGISPPRASFRYEDRDDGTGQRCRNDADPSRQGFLEEGTDVFFDDASIFVVHARLTDNGDNDGFADPGETVSMFLTLRNPAQGPYYWNDIHGIDRHGLVVRIASNDPSVDCVLQPVVAFGDLAAGESRESPVPVVFRVADVMRTAVEGDLTATFQVSISGQDFGALSLPQTVVLDLDLDASGGLFPGTYTEGFEGAGFGSFTTQSLDAGRESMAASDGFRCQYNDPDFVNSNSYRNLHCFLGAPTTVQNGYDWHVHTASAPDGGRAYLGNNSLHWGVHLGAASADTTRLRQLDAIRTTNPINLGWNGVTPELSFKHQVGLTDCDYVGCSYGRAVDRGVVQVQLATQAGISVGNWRKIYPYENVYDSQGVDYYTNCMFDPVDDGNDEDDYFDPTDPNRRLGPSSTCMPEFTFSRLGSIYFSAVFYPGDIHHASDGPGLQGSRGPGTWVESKFDLGRWRGRRIRFRFLATSIEVGSALTMQDALGWNPIEADDGWYIDDVRVANTLVSAATISVDTADRSGLPGCGSGCSSVTAALSATPATTGAPGRITQLDAAGSSTDRCVDGILQFRFWEDRNGNQVLGDADDTLLRTWTDNPLLLEAPDRTTRYGVQVRCSALTSCSDEATVVVNVPCPSTGNAVVPFAQTIGFASKTQLSWGASVLVDAVRGDLAALRASGGQFNGTVEACLGNDLAASSIVDATTPSPGQGEYYLVRGAGASPYCNADHSWGTGVPAEVGDRDAGIPLDPDACP